MLFATLLATGADLTTPWRRHAIDDSSKGADGVRLADANRDGLPDIVTGWEEGGLVRVYINPGRNARGKWPAVTVGKAPSVEDAVFVDVDSDGALDVLSSSEGNERAMHVHWAPRNEDYLKAEAWRTETFPASRGKMQWMFCLPMQIDGKHGVDLIAGAKGKDAELGWWEAPQNARALAAWKWHPLREAGWIMSIIASDMDRDGDADIVVSDRRGARTGCFWLENPGAAKASRPWREHAIGALGEEVKFLTLSDLDGDKLDDVLVATKASIILLRQTAPTGRAWTEHRVRLPDSAGGGKAVAVGDIDRDGRRDIVFTCEGAVAKSGVMWLSHSGDPFTPNWTAHDISGRDGVKHDLVELLDLDADGDLDVLTCEETTGLGVFWFENPSVTAH